MNARDWDRLADAYHTEVCDIFLRDQKDVTRRWLEARGLLTDRKTLLDVGCGIGSFIKKFGRRFGEKTGIDHSGRMLQIAARRCRSIPGCRWMQADLQRVPTSLHQYADLVVCSNVISFVSLAACRRAMRELLPCSKPGGWLLVILASLESHQAVIAYEKGRARRRHHGITAVVRRDDRMQRCFSATGVRQLANCAGLRSVRLQKVWYPWIDEGVTRGPRDVEPPWSWFLSGQSPTSRGAPRRRVAKDSS